MGLFSKLFGAKSAAPAPAAPARAELPADDPRAAARQCLEEVDALIAATEDARARLSLRAEIAVGLARAGDADGALAALAVVVEEGLGLAAPSWISGVLAEAFRGLERGARARAQGSVRALAEVAAEMEPEEGAELQSELAPLFALTGDLDSALAAADAIDDPYFAAEARAAVIEILCENEELVAAERALAGMSSADALSRARKALASAKLLAGAVDEAAELSKLIRTSPWREAAAADVALARAQRGDVEGALALARAIDDPSTCGAALADIAELVADAGDLERAAEIAASIEERETRSRGFGRLALAHARRGDVAAADEALARIESPIGHVLIALDVADTAAVRALAADRQRYLGAALQTLRTASGPDAERYRRQLATRILAEAGNVAEALELAVAAPGPDERRTAFGEIARGLVRNADLAGLDELVERLNNPVDRAGVLTAAAFALFGAAREKK